MTEYMNNTIHMIFHQEFFILAKKTMGQAGIFKAGIIEVTEYGIFASRLHGFEVMRLRPILVSIRVTGLANLARRRGRGRRCQA